MQGEQTAPKPARAVVGFAAAALLGSAGFWRAVLAWRHYRASLTLVGDPSLRELEEVTALVETGLAILLLAHAGGAWLLAKRPVRFDVKVAVGVAALLAVLFGLSLLQNMFHGTGGWYPAFAIAGCAALAYVFPRRWLSFYSGSVVGSAIAWWSVSPEPDVFVGLFVVAPSVAFALLGAGVGSVLRGWIKSRAP